MNAIWHHMAIAVENIERSKSFYCHELGFEIEWEHPNYCNVAIARVVGLDQADAHVVMLKGYDTRIELFHYHHPQGKVLPPLRQCDFGLTHFAFSVQKIQALYDQLSARGVSFNCPPQNLRSGVWATYMHDPDGNTIELVEYEKV